MREQIIGLPPPLYIFDCCANTLTAHAQALHGAKFPRGHQWMIILENHPPLPDKHTFLHKAHVIVYHEPTSLAQWTAVESNVDTHRNELTALRSLLAEIQMDVTLLFEKEYPEGTPTDQRVPKRYGFMPYDSDDCSSIEQGDDDNTGDYENDGAKKSDEGTTSEEENEGAQMNRVEGVGRTIGLRVMRF